MPWECIITYTSLYHWRTLWNAMRSIDPEDEDTHAKVYPEVPGWWHWDFLVFSFLVVVIAVERWPADVPVYSLIVAITVPALYVVPGRAAFRNYGTIVHILEGLWELANDIFLYSSNLICWVKLSLELCSLGTPGNVPRAFSPPFCM